MIQRSYSQESLYVGMHTWYLQHLSSQENLYEGIPTVEHSWYLFVWYDTRQRDKLLCSVTVNNKEQMQNKCVVPRINKKGALLRWNRGTAWWTLTYCSALRQPASNNVCHRPMPFYICTSRDLKQEQFYCWKRETSTRARDALRASLGRAPCRVSAGASKVAYAQHTAHREMDLHSS